jgi:hypothetical protein
VQDGEAVNLLGLEVDAAATAGGVATIDPAQRATAEAIASRLGWDLLEPVTAPSPTALRVARLAALARAGREADGEAPAAAPDRWLDAAFQQPLATMLLLAIAAFGAAAGLLVALGAPERHFAALLGAVGAVFLLALLWLSGARRLRRRAQQAQRSPGGGVGRRPTAD